MLRINFRAILLLSFFFVAAISFGQEKAPLKQFEYNISLNKLKTETQAGLIKNGVSQLDGVRDCELVLIEYNLHFQCSNHDMTTYRVMDKVKEVILRNGSEIVQIKRTEINE